MHGNVWEWCRDWSVDELPGGTNPEVTSRGSARVFRGGSWDNSAEYCRSASRSRVVPGFRYYFLGFHVAAVPSSK
jgi:formylglycine-generating enzyme required for sulfatase activity